MTFHRLMTRGALAGMVIIATALTASCKAQDVRPSGPKTRAAALDLPADFIPTDDDFAFKETGGRFLGIAGFRGRVMKPRNGVNALYVEKATPGRFRSDPIAVGDVILGLDGEPLDEDPAYDFKKSVGNAFKADGLLTVTRWRRGTIEALTLDLNPRQTGLSDVGDRKIHAGLERRHQENRAGYGHAGGPAHAETMTSPATREP